MKKSSLFFIASILGLASLTGIGSLVSSDGNSIQGARATGVIEDGKYFILNSDGTRAMYKGSSISASDDEKSKISVPFDIEYDSTNNYYNISVTMNETEHFLRGNSTGQVNLRNDSDRCKNWIITYDEGTHLYSLKLTDYTLYLTYSSNFRLVSESTYSIQLIPVSSFISGMATIPCEGYTDTDEKSEAWKSLGSSLDITVKNYLKGIECDKSASLSTIEGSLAKYDYVIAKYSDREKYPNFLSRDVKDIHYFDTYRIETKENNNSGYLLIGVISISIVMMGITLLNIKKKKRKLMN